MDVAICIATCARPDGLRRLLEAMAGQAFQGDRPSLRYIIADNDAAETGPAVRTVLDEMAPRLAAPIDYAVELRRGISFARNNCVERALDADFLVFIDDDGAPCTGWLDALLHTQAATGSDVIGGPVAPRYEAPPPEWALEGRFFERADHHEGALLDVVFTGNAMARGAIFKDGDFRFDECYALTGGGDTQLFRRVHRAGYRIVWSADAIVHDYVTPRMMTPKWVVQRSFSIGWRDAFIERDLNPGLRGTLRTIDRGFMRIVVGLAKLIRFSFGARYRRIAAVRSMADGIGRLSVLVGYRSKYYRS